MIIETGKLRNSFKGKITLPVIIKPFLECSDNFPKRKIGNHYNKISKRTQKIIKKEIQRVLNENY